MKTKTWTGLTAVVTFFAVLSTSSFGAAFEKKALFVVNEPGVDSSHEIHCMKGNWIRVSVTTPKRESSDGRITEYKYEASKNKGYQVKDVAITQATSAVGDKKFLQATYSFYVTLDGQAGVGEPTTSEIDITVKDEIGGQKAEANMKQHFMAH